MVSDYPDLGCLPEGAGAIECWIDGEGHGSDGHGPDDRPSMYFAMLDTGMGEEYWIGPLEPAIDIAATTFPYARVRKALMKGGRFEVYMSRTDLDGMSITNVEQNADAWGNGETLEEAWRHTLTAVFGPVDDMYDEHHLDRLFAQYLDPPPEPMTPTSLERWLER